MIIFVFYAGLFFMGEHSKDFGGTNALETSSNKKSFYFNVLFNLMIMIVPTVIFGRPYFPDLMYAIFLVITAISGTKKQCWELFAFVSKLDRTKLKKPKIESYRNRWNLYCFKPNQTETDWTEFKITLTQM